MPSSNPVFLHSTWCGVVGMSWIGALLISSCIMVTFIKRWNVIALSAYHFRPCIAAREQCQLSIVLKSCLGSCACKED